MGLRYAALAAGLLVAFPAMAATDLVCDGHGALTAGNGKPAVALDPAAPGGVTADYADRVKLHLDEAAGTATLPLIMVPAPLLPYGHKKSIWPLAAMQKSEDAIEADITFDLLHRTHLHIDRVTGNLTVSGYDSFTGVCAPYNPDDIKKLF